MPDAESLLLAAIKHCTRDSEEDKHKIDEMTQAKAKDAAYNSHKKGWVPGGTAEKGHFVEDERRRSPSPGLESETETEMERGESLASASECSSLAESERERGGEVERR